ncbi:MAG TPA: hypothetical protein VFD77_02200 [Brumimicrobium sp.]|nr:hypothetical protein [Brumimicrobium sp.]
MNKIKLSIIGLGFFFSSAVFAQEMKTELNKEQRMEKRMDKFAEELGLTEDQKSQIMEMRKNSYAERKKIKNDESLDEASKKEAMKALHIESKAKMNEVLTEEQALKLKAMKEERKANQEKRSLDQEKPSKNVKTREHHNLKEHKAKKRELKVVPLEKQTE